MSFARHDSARPGSHGRRLRRCGIAACALLTSAAGSQAATLVIDILSTDDPEAMEVVVAPGARVPYAVVGELFSDDENAPDNEGLASLNFDILTDLGVAQPRATELDPAVLDTFDFITDLGIPVDDDITDIGGLLFDFVNPSTGLAVGSAQVIARGELVTPDVEGTFQAVIAADGDAIVLVASASEADPFDSERANFEPGEGLTIITQIGADDPPASGEEPDPAAVFPQVLLGAAAAVLLATVGGLVFGPVGFVLGLMIGALGGLSVFAG